MKKKEDNIDLLKYEKELYDKGITLIGGVDEVGRGPLVGPVVAACVILPKNYELQGLTDSKKISEKKREQLYDIIMKDAISVGVGIVGPEKIDEINILEASRLAMKIAIENLDVKPEFILSDAMKLNNIDIPYLDIVHGDALSLSIAAGSVIAKVTRDRMMYELDEKYPEYGFARHKGYPTKAHLESLEKFGILSNYRFTYKPVSDLINKEVVIRK
jgi:ribonuclease HII